MEKNRSGRRHQRMECKFMKNRNRLLTFTKRRDEIFKEASELCTLFGINIVILITSLCGRTYCFAHPNVESVESQFFYHTLLPKGILEPYWEVHIKELNKELDNVRDKWEAEERRGKILKEKRDNRPRKLWEKPITELSPIEVEKARQQLDKLQGLIFNMFNRKYLGDEAFSRLEESTINNM
ncbi:hypothetical protein L6452_01689 [Arctium lappa]|uniref:Uncharacterized protein n=1 Tax=Arctium lappa TaxID=4217 RepID=A0ACB9FHB5_ARCLA|nr:hypothetical protein L6452_01689 [Arctium lappa]